MGGDGAKYWAFISYSHRDTRAAVALQRALETYRLPRRLIGKRTPVGEAPAFLKPVFRDRDEMEAGADLKATVREALQQSRYLIVLCSPAAARSPWVNREVIEFKKLHGEQRVLACIAGGEPFASREPGREAEECFPEALRFALTPEGNPQGEPLEPVAADLRPQGDGKRRAMLKLVAGMVGVGVDELVHRDSQRRARRMAMLATASLAGMAVMAVLTVMAVQARIEAQSQRVQAEDLVEFMLGDLRKKLDAVGRLDVLDSVGAKALAYYARQEAERLDADALGRRSRAMHLIGEMREQRGHLVEALTAFQSAADTTARLLARAPQDGKRIFDHAQSVYWVGYIAWQRGQAEAAEEAFLKYRELAQQLVRIDPGNVDWQLETAYANQNIGVVRLESMRPAEALGSFTETKNVRERMLGAKPDLVFELADSHGWIAKAREAAGDYEGAIAAQRERLTVLNAAAADPEKDRRVQQQIANANVELGRLHLNLGNAEDAEPYARAAVQQADALAASDPANMFWLSQAAFHRLSLAELELARGMHADARSEIARAMAELPRLLANDASNVNWAVRLRGRGLMLKILAGTAGEEPLARECEIYLAAVKAIEARDKRLKANQAQVAAMVELLLGDMRHRSGHADAAGVHWRSAADRLRSHANAGDHPAQTLRARLYLRLDQRDQAGALAARLAESQFRHPVYAEFVNELSLGTGTQSVQLSPREGKHASPGKRHGNGGRNPG